MSKRKSPSERVFCEVVITKLLQGNRKADQSQVIQFMGGLCYQALMNLSSSMIEHNECLVVDKLVPTVEIDSHFSALQQKILNIDTECRYTIDNLLFGLYKRMYPHHLAYSQSSCIHALIEQVYDKYVKRVLKDDFEMMGSLFEDRRLQSQMFGYMLSEVEWFTNNYDRFKEDEVSEVVKYGMVVVLVSILSLMLQSMSYKSDGESWCNELESKCKHLSFYSQLFSGYKVRVKKWCTSKFLTADHK